MGVPKFFRWLSERYPKINHRVAYPVEEETFRRYFDHDEDLPPPFEEPDPLSKCGLSPEIDRLYIDMNGVLHGCSHNNSDNDKDSYNDSSNKNNNNDNNEQPKNKNQQSEKLSIFRNICYYLDRLVGDIAQPKQLVYMAIDGVAPRAKLNQQRSRRYRGGNGKNNELEKTIYDEIMHRQQYNHDKSDKSNDHHHTNNKGIHHSNFRFSGKFQTQHNNTTGDTHHDQPHHFDFMQDDADGGISFHSNAITPGTTFFEECVKHLEHWIHYKLSTDPKWQHLEIIFSGADVPGEGEHKIMDFMRQERCCNPDYDPNLRHCIVGQDGDLILLGLATHEPNLCLLRERVLFDARRRLAASTLGVDAYTHNVHFEWLHMSVLRDYLMYEFETAPAIPDSPWDRERTLDDFVFLTFLVGNDFLPSLPALDIGDEAFELLFHVYKRLRWQWLQQHNHDKKRDPYLTKAGEIVSGRRLEKYLATVGSHETAYYDNKKYLAPQQQEKFRKQDAKAGRESTIPSQETLDAKEALDRAKYREMIMKQQGVLAQQEKKKNSVFRPVLSENITVFQGSGMEEEQGGSEKGLLSRMANLLQQSLSQQDNDREASVLSDFDDQDLKGRYYYDKFQFTPMDAQKHLALRKSYLEGLVWNLKYYYQGCVSWDWYYPYHYGPMLSDLVNIEEILKGISFQKRDSGKPLKPFEQLMGCMPPSSAYLLPKPYQHLLTDPNSPISDFYPTSFTVDMNGKRWPWEAVVLLPFIDSERLINAANTFVKDEMLTEEEKRRNRLGTPVVFHHDSNGDHRRAIPALESGIEVFGALDSTARCLDWQDTQWHQNVAKQRGMIVPVFQPKLLPDVETPKPGFPTLAAAPIQSLQRKRFVVNVFGTRSRYRTAILETSEDLMPLPSFRALASELIGTTVYINYPYLVEGFVTGVSNSEMTIRGNKSNHEMVHQWNTEEADAYSYKWMEINEKMERGEGLSGTGGWKLPANNDVLLTVRPLRRDLQTLSKDTIAKVYAKFEMEVPLLAALWSPSRPDPRIAELQMALEKDPYFMKTTISSSSSAPQPKQRVSMSRSFSSAVPGLTRSFAKPTRPLRQPTRSFHAPGPASFSTKTVMRGSPRRRLLMAGIVGAAMMFSSNPNAFAGAEQHPFSLSYPNRFSSAASPFTTGGSIPQQTPFDDHDVPPLEFARGTTTLAFVFQGGIIVAVDSRASLGNFVGSKTTEKVLPINSHVLGTMAGGAADCSFWIRKLRAEAALHERNQGHRMTVARISRMLSNALHRMRGYGLSVGTMISGFDHDEGASIYYVDNTGVRIKGDMFAVGSGSTYALSVLDNHEQRYGMTEQEAVALGVRAIRHATYRDAGSGGFINVYLITKKDGWKRVFREDLATTSQTKKTE